MASKADSLKSEPARPDPNGINHPYSNQFEGSIVAPDPKEVECSNKLPRLPYRKLLIIADLLK